MESSNLIFRLAEEVLVDHARKKNQVYLITSAVDGEGCSSIAKLLADGVRRLSAAKSYLISVSKHELGQPEPDGAPDFHRSGFFEELKSNYNVIVIDAGGLLNRGRAVPFLAECHACILVTRAGETRRGQVKETVEMIKRYNIPILGAVLNGIERVIPESLYKRL
jgi:Mrp family chromosome partitioning ATPase